MDDQELQQLLDAGRETPSFEVKRAMPWDHASLAKDILALANVRDGGVIVIGVEDQSFERQGVDRATKATYKVDEMRDQMTRYADPHVDIRVTFPCDADGKEYVAIEVAPFNELPVICRRNGSDVHEGVIYYRNSNRRIESAPVSNSYDMRDIILTAVTRMESRLQGLGLHLSADSDDWARELDEELGGL